MSSVRGAASLDWLVRRPVAHRGLHDSARGIVENSTSAARAAQAADYAIECDVQRSADGQAMVFHDERLDRLTELRGDITAFGAATLTATRLVGSDDAVPTLPQLFDLVAGRVPLVCEIKSRFDGDPRLADRVATLAADYAGPLAIKSFDPAVIAHLRRMGLDRPLGIVAEARFDDADFAGLDEARRQTLIHGLHFAETRPDFVSYCADDLPHALPHLCRVGLGLPVLAWTVRTEPQARHAALWADQIVFEAMRP